MTIRYFLLKSITILICASAIACAEDKSNKAQELMQLMGIERQMMGGFDAMMPAIDQMGAQMDLNLTERDELIKIYRDWYENDIDRKALIQGIVVLYEETYTTQEMDDMIAFFKTPTGQKMLEKSPELMQKGAMLGMQEAQSKQAELMARLKPFLEKHAQQ